VERCSMADLRVSSESDIGKVEGSVVKLAV